MEIPGPRQCSESGIRERREITPDGDNLPAEVFLCASHYRAYCMNLGVCAIGGGYRPPKPAEAQYMPEQVSAEVTDITPTHPGAIPDAA